MGTQSKEELVARRDEIVAQLQGDWIPEMDKGKFRERSVKIGFKSVWYFTVTFALMFIFYIVTDGDGVSEIGLPIIALLYISCVIALCVCVVVVSYWTLRICSMAGPLHGHENMLSKVKRKGYVPERIDLYKLMEVRKVESPEMPTSCVFISVPHVNTPQIVPGVYKDGDRLIRLLEDIAGINSKLNELDKSVS